MDDERDEELEAEFWGFVTARVMGLILADLIAHPVGARELMESLHA